MLLQMIFFDPIALISDYLLNLNILKTLIILLFLMLSQILDQLMDKTMRPDLEVLQLHQL